MREITEDKFPCPKCGTLATNVNYVEGHEDHRTFRCPKCEFVFNTVERIIPGTVKDKDGNIIG
ncbi:MAG: hypothetical protein UZ05_CHB002000239 [Chlorobi bacterium OLB5]|nr:MAG: hypothetical protein UZ05_CHB002000239 [Chlorobi bacterium OLB5]